MTTPRPPLFSRLSLPAALVACVCVSASAAYAEGQGGIPGLSFWGTGGTTTDYTASGGPALLRPPSSWSWDGPAPQLDAATGLGHRFTNGLNLDLGLSLAHVPERADSINYRDYFLGLSYGSIDGKVWYLPETGLDEEAALYYEAGWHQPVTDKLSLSLRLGQYGAAYGAQTGEGPNLSFGASTVVGGYGLGLRVVDQGGSAFGGDQDFRLMGSITKSLR